MKNITTRDLVFLALCVCIGFATKGLISPATNILTDFIRIPGGSTAAGFSLMFLCVGVYETGIFGCGTLMGLAQGCLALLLGLSGYQGFLCIVTYSLPGFVIDCVYLLCHTNRKTFFLLSCALANVAGAFLSNFLVFHLSGIAFALWMLMGAISGFGGGWFGAVISERVMRVGRLA